MKNRSVNHLILLVGIIVLFVGCRTYPVFNVTDASFTPASGKEPTLEDVTKAIVSASTHSQPPWNMKVVKPGHIVATLHIRTHMAQVDIVYTTKGYSITRKATSNLKYKPEDDTIHEGYNKWVQLLNTNIQVELNML